MTRTLWVTNDFPPRAGGIEQFVRQLVGSQDPGDVHVITSAWPGAEAYDRQLAFPVDRVRRPMLPEPALLRRIRRAIETHRAQVVVFGAAWPLGELAGHLEIPTVALTHGHEAGMAKVGLGPLVRRVARAVDAIGVISEFTHRELSPWIDGHTTVRYLPPGVDADRFNPAVDGTAIRARLGIDPDHPMVLCIGRLVRRKGQDVLVAAWPRVRRDLPEATLVLGGGGSLGQYLARRVSRLGLEQSVLLAGEIPGDELPAWHASADLFAMPCRSRLGGLDVEGLGIVYLEAQACGRPVLAGDSGGAPEALVPGGSGRVVDGRDVEAVARIVVELLSDPAGLRDMGAAGRAFVEEHYAWSAIGRRFVRLVEDVATSAASAD